MAALFATFVAVGAPVWWALASNAPQFQGQINDFPHYEPYVQYLRVWPPSSGSPHFLYPLLVKALSSFTSLQAGATVVMSLAFGLAAAAIHWMGRRSWDSRPPLGPVSAAVVPLAFLVMESPALLVPAGRTEWFARAAIDPIGTGGGVFLIHVWGSPPSVLQIALSLVLVIGLLDVLHPERAGWWPLGTWGLVGATALVAFAKPATLLVLLVAAPLYPFVGRRNHSEVRWRALLLGFLLPGATCVVGQSLFLTSGVSPFQQAGVKIEPFWLVGLAQLYRPVVWSGVLVVAVALAISGRRYLADPPVRLLLLALAVSFVPTFILREVSQRNPNDALAWTFVLTAQLLLIVTLRFLALEVRDAWRRRTTEGAPLPWWVVPLGVLSVLFTAAGVYHYLVLVGLVSYPVLPSMAV